MADCFWNCQLGQKQAGLLIWVYEKHFGRQTRVDYLILTISYLFRIGGHPRLAAFSFFSEFFCFVDTIPRQPTLNENSLDRKVIRRVTIKNFVAT